MRNILFMPFLLIITLASCIPSTLITPTVINTASQKTILTSTNTPTPKPSATISLAASETSSPTAEPFIMGSQTSPNGEYIAYSYFYYGTEQQIIEIKNKKGKLIWQIPFQGELPHYDPRPTISIYRWSNDSSQLYFCYNWSPDGGDIFVQGSCNDLQKIDIKTGEIQPVLLGNIPFAISFDGSQIAYIRCQGESCIIYVRNLSTGLEKTAYVILGSKNYVAIGNMEWSPNGNGLVFVMQDNNYMLQTIYLDLSTMKHRMIMKYPAPESPGWAEFERWVDNNTLEFLELGDNGVQVIHIDVRNDKISVVGTPTPNQ